MTSQESSSAPESSSQGFVEQGADLVRAVGTLTLRIVGCLTAPPRAKVILNLKNGTKLLCLDKISLEMEKNREEFLAKCPEGERTTLREASSAERRTSCE